MTPSSFVIIEVFLRKKDAIRPSKTFVKITAKQIRCLLLAVFWLSLPLVYLLQAQLHFSQFSSSLLTLLKNSTTCETNIVFQNVVFLKRMSLKCVVQIDIRWWKPFFRGGGQMSSSLPTLPPAVHKSCPNCRCFINLRQFGCKISLKHTREIGCYPFYSPTYETERTFSLVWKSTLPISKQLVCFPTRYFSS